MVTGEQVRKIALSFPEVTEEPHFDKTSFRVAKKIFTTMDAAGTRAMAKLKPFDQNIFCTINGGVIYPVPNKWGEGGATFIELNKVKEELLTEILKSAYKGVAPAKLADLVEFR